MAIYHFLNKKKQHPTISERELFIFLLKNFFKQKIFYSKTKPAMWMVEIKSQQQVSPTFHTKVFKNFTITYLTHNDDDDDIGQW